MQDVKTDAELRENMRDIATGEPCEGGNIYRADRAFSPPEHCEYVDPGLPLEAWIAYGTLSALLIALFAVLLAENMPHLRRALRL